MDAGLIVSAAILIVSCLAGFGWTRNIVQIMRNGGKPKVEQESRRLVVFRYIGVFVPMIGAVLGYF
jgi:hypothetical protein